MDEGGSECELAVGCKKGGRNHLVEIRCMQQSAVQDKF